MPIYMYNLVLYPAENNTVITRTKEAMLNGLRP